jgi:hypothetical protein
LPMSVMNSRRRRSSTGSSPRPADAELLGAPWAIKTYVAFADKKGAFAFEKYLKSPSSRAFAKKRIMNALLRSAPLRRRPIAEQQEQHFSRLSRTTSPDYSARPGALS